MNLMSLASCDIRIQDDRLLYELYQTGKLLNAKIVPQPSLHSTSFTAIFLFVGP